MTTVQNTGGIPDQFIAGNDVHFDYEQSAAIAGDPAKTGASNKKKKKKKKKSQAKAPVSPDSDYPESRIITGGPQNTVVVTPMASTSAKKKKKDKADDIWESSVEEKRALKEFWLSLPVQDQQSLMSISKENVLQAIRDNDKINCDCSLCGRKRDAIEKELEVMYESYYDAFNTAAHGEEQHLDQDTVAGPSFVDTLFNPLGSNSDGIMSIAEDLLSNNGTKFLDIMEKLAERRMAREFQHNQESQHYDHLDEFADGEEDEPCSECGRLSHEYDEDDDEEEEDVDGGEPHGAHYGDDERHRYFLHDHFCGPDHQNGFDFSADAAQQLQHHMNGHHDTDAHAHHDHHHDTGHHAGHGPKITPVDDLDQGLVPAHGAKNLHNSVLSHPHISAIESEMDVARKVREGAADYLAKHGDLGVSSVQDIEEDEEEDEEDEDFEDEYEDEDEEGDEIYDEEENYDDNASIDEERRFEEARRMIQLFTTRMFHDRLLEKYKLKIANDRSNKLLEELELEEKRKKEKEEKKLKQKEKAKEKKRLQQAAKEEEKARREAERAEAERKEQEEKLKRAEEQRKKEEEKKAKRLEEQKKKAAELDRVKREKAEKERLKREGRQKKKDDEKKKKEEEDAAAAAALAAVEIQRQRETSVQAELEAQAEKLQQLDLNKEINPASNPAAGLQMNSQNTSTTALGSAAIGESVPVHGYNQFEHAQQQVDPLSAHRHGSQPDFNALTSMPNFNTPPPPGILPPDALNQTRNSIPGVLPQPQALLQPQQQQQQHAHHPQHEMLLQQMGNLQLPSVQQQGQTAPSLIPLQDPWIQRNNLLKENQGGLFENATPLSHHVNPTSNGFPSGHLNTVGLNHSLDPSNFNKFSGIPNDAPLSNSFNGLNGLSDTNWGSKDIWSRADNSIGFNSRSNSLWTESAIPSPPQMHSQLLQTGPSAQQLQQAQQAPQPQIQSIIPPITGDDITRADPTNWGRSTNIDEPSAQMVSLIQQAVVQAYQQISQGSTWAPRNVLFNETQAVLGGMVNLTMNMFLRSISSSSITHWFEVNYDDYGAVSMVRVRAKGSATQLNHMSFQPFDNGETHALKSVNGLLANNSFSNIQSGFGDSVHNGTNEPLYDLWNSGSF